MKLLIQVQEGWMAGDYELEQSLETSEGTNGGQEIDIRAIFGLLRRQFRLIAVTFFSVLIVSALFALSLTPKYTATSLILVDPVEKNLLDPAASTTRSNSELARVESEALILKSDAALLAVVSDQDLISDTEFGVSIGLREWLTGLLMISEVELPSGQEALNEVLDNLRAAVDVQRRGTTFLIDVSVQSEYPDRAADLANAISNAYIADQVQVKIASALATRDILQRRLEQAQQSLTENERNVNSFVFDNIDRIVAETGVAGLSDLRNQIQQMETRRAATSQLAEIVSEGIEARDWETLRQSLESDAAAALADKRDEIASRLFGVEPSSQREIDLKAELEAVEEQLKSTARIELSTMQADLIEAESGISSLQGEIRTAALNSDLPADLLTNIFGLQQNAAVSRSQYQLLLSRLRDVEAQAEMQVPDSRVVSPAIPPSNPSFPNLKLMIGFAGVFGLSLGVGLAYLRENYIGGFISDVQMQSVLRIPVLTSVPMVKSTLTETHSPADLLIDAPISVYSEAIRRMRAGVDQSVDRMNVAGNSRDKTGAVIMVTSALPGEGKSSMSLSLGRTYAISGKSTIVIDCDLRRPSIHLHLNLKPNAGLTNYLSGEHEAISIGEALTRDPMSALTVVVGMRRPSTSPDQLVMGPQFEKLIDSLRKKFEIVILDSPPIGPVVDGLYLAKNADVIVLAVQWADTAQVDARKALAALRDSKRADTEILGAINGTDDNGSAYSGRYSGYFEDN